VDDEPPRDHLAVLEAWATPAELRRVLRRVSPDDLSMYLDAVGSPREAATFLATAKKLVEEWAWRASARERLGRWIKAFILAGTAIAIANGAIIWAVLKWPW
jgi:hypothetical protein